MPLLMHVALMSTFTPDPVQDRDGSIELREGFHRTEQWNKMLAAAAILVLPYRQAHGSAIRAARIRLSFQRHKM